MKHLYLILILFMVATTQGQTQDTLYVWKAGKLVIKKSIKPVDIDSISFKRPVVIIPITIGTQTWTTKNLDVTTYSDGTVIPQVTDGTAWVGLTTGAWCYYENNTANGTTYGKLYNWYAVAGIHDNDPTTPNKKLAPSGYHIPSDAEWTTLTTYLAGPSAGGYKQVGGKMKETGYAHWNSPNSGASNSGFTGLPGGGRIYSTGYFQGIGNNGNWWSSSEYDSITVWFRQVTFSSSLVNVSNLNKYYGFSVRCLRD